MSFDNSKISLNTWTLTQKVNVGFIRFDNLIQRGYVWKVPKQSLFIHSVTIGIPIQTMYAKRFDGEVTNEDGDVIKGQVLDILDGQQRIHTISRFINNEFALSAGLPIIQYNSDTKGMQEIDISKKKYCDLPEELKMKFNNISVDIICFDHLSYEEERELFTRLNAGVALNAKNKSLALINNLEDILEIGKHPIFEDMLTMWDMNKRPKSSRKLENKEQATYVIKAWIVLNQQKNSGWSLENKYIQKVMEDIEVSDSEREELESVFSYYLEVQRRIEKKQRINCELYKKLYMDKNFFIVIYIVKDAIRSNIDPDRFIEWLETFFLVSSDDIGLNGQKESNYTEYNQATYKHATSHKNLMTCLLILQHSYETFFSKEMIDRIQEEQE